MGEYFNFSFCFLLGLFNRLFIVFFVPIGKRIVNILCALTFINVILLFVFLLCVFLFGPKSIMVFCVGLKTNVLDLKFSGH
jgi:hypothetical protein